MPSNSHKRLFSIPSILPIDDFQIIEEGCANTCYRVKSRVNEYFVKLYPETLPQKSSVSQLQTIQKIVADAGIAPPLIDQNPQSGYLVSRFIDAFSLSHPNNQHLDKIALLTKALVKCHSVKIDEGFTPLDLPSVFEHLLSRLNISEQQACHFKRYVNTILAKINASSGQYCLIHGDLNYGNIMINAKTLMVVDWDSGHYFDAEYDIAMACSINRLCTAETLSLVKKYQKHLQNGVKVDPLKVTRYLVLSNLINGLWYLYEKSVNDQTFSPEIEKAFIMPVLALLKC